MPYKSVTFRVLDVGPGEIRTLKIGDYYQMLEVCMIERIGDGAGFRITNDEGECIDFYGLDHELRFEPDNKKSIKQNI